MKMINILISLHLGIGVFLTLVDWVAYYHTFDEIDMDFVFNRIIFMLLWEIGIIAFLWEMIHGRRTIGDLKP